MGRLNVLFDSKIDNLKAIYLWKQHNYFVCIQKSRKQVLDRVIGHISSNPDLWDSYFKDLIVCQLKLKDRSSDTQRDVAHQLIYTFFESLHKCEVLDRIVKVHCHIAVHQLKLAKMATHLRPLSELQMVR